MYGLIGNMIATTGERDALIAHLLQATTGMPGCLSYIIADDPTNADGIWITEVWESQAHHDASLQLPAVQAAIAQARPLIAESGPRYETRPRGGIGLPGDGRAQA